MVAANLVKTIDGVSFYLWRDVVVIHQHGIYTMEAARFREMGPPRSRRSDVRRARTVLIVDPSAPSPGDEVRTELAKNMSEGNAIAFAVVTNEEGFRSALVASVMTGLKLAARTHQEMKVFTTLSEAASWVGGFAPAGNDGPELATALGALKTAAR